MHSNDSIDQSLKMDHIGLIMNRLVHPFWEGKHWLATIFTALPACGRPHRLWPLISTDRSPRGPSSSCIIHRNSSPETGRRLARGWHAYSWNCDRCDQQNYESVNLVFTFCAVCWLCTLRFVMELFVRKSEREFCPGDGSLKVTSACQRVSAL